MRFWTPNYQIDPIWFIKVAEYCLFTINAPDFNPNAPAFVTHLQGSKSVFLSVSWKFNTVTYYHDDSVTDKEPCFFYVYKI